jgi:hypothetical protein
MGIAVVFLFSFFFTQIMDLRIKKFLITLFLMMLSHLNFALCVKNGILIICLRRAVFAFGAL